MISVSNLSAKAQCVVQFFLLHHLLISSMPCPQKKTHKRPRCKPKECHFFGGGLIDISWTRVSETAPLSPTINLLVPAFLVVHLQQSLLSACSCSSFLSVPIPLSLTSPAKKIPCRFVFRTPGCWRCGLWPLRGGNTKQGTSASFRW
jgi:hypothetical protein